MIIPSVQRIIWKLAHFFVYWKKLSVSRRRGINQTHNIYVYASNVYIVKYEDLFDLLLFHIRGRIINITFVVVDCNIYNFLLLIYCFARKLVTARVARCAVNGQ